MQKPSKPNRPSVARVLVLGGGAAGQRAAVDLRRAGVEVILVEEGDTLGGTMARLGTMFPLHNCLLCRGEDRHGAGCTRPTLSAELLDYSRPSGLTVLTRSRLVALDSRRWPSGDSHGAGGGQHRAGADPRRAAFQARILREPRYVVPERCILCDRCSQTCPQCLADPFEAGLSEHKAVYRPADRCVPESYAVARGPYCEGCGKCAEACPTGAIDLGQKAVTEQLEVHAVVVATGMRLYDPAMSDEYGYGRFPNVITGLEMERMCSPAGPGEGRVFRPGDGTEPARIAWLQCVGSRDKEHDYCSSFCCGFATRQAVAARRLLPSAEARVFMLDDRVFARGFSAAYDPLREAYGIGLERCRVSVLRQDPATGDLVLQVQGDDGKVREETYGLVVLSVGAQAALKQGELREVLGLEADEFGFLRTGTLDPLDTPRPGVFVAGAAAGPADLADSVTAGSAAAARVCAYLGLRHGPPQALADLNARPKNGTPRLGIFACHCAGDIGGTIDLEGLMPSLAGQPAVHAAEILPFGCLPEGLDAIKSSIRERELTGIVVGACKRRTYAPLFESALPVPVRFVSLREENAYVHPEDPAGATRKARDQLAHAAEGLRRALEAEADAPPLEAALPPPNSALVLGGGLAGLTAALHVADAGVPVHLVEREDHLGGNVLRLDRTPEGQSLPRVIEELAGRAVSHPRITVHMGCEVVRQSSDDSRFSARIRNRREGKAAEFLLSVGAEIIATGAEEYRGPAYGLGRRAKVVTLLDLGERMRDDPQLPLETREVVFVGCVGPWDRSPGDRSPWAQSNGEGNRAADPWRCSRGCCETMIRRARAFREKNPACRSVVLVREVNTYGFREQEYTAARKAGVLFVRFDPRSPPRFSREGKLRVEDQNLGEVLEFDPQLVVLSAAILPRHDAHAVAAAIEVPLDADGFYQEWEGKSRPYATLEPGVFVCGLAHGPKPLREVVPQALAAAQSALGHLATLRRVDPQAVARVSAGECVSCLTCVRTCPYGVPRVGSRGSGGAQGKARIDALRCQGCGACVSECPAGAISLGGYSDEGLLGRGIPGDSPAGHPPEGPTIAVITCRYCGNVPIELAGTARIPYPASVRTTVVPCTGLVKPAQLLEALEQGADGVLVHACPEGSCHHLSGNLRAGKRVEHLRALLEATGVPPARLRFANLGIGHGRAFAELIRAMAGELQELEPGAAEPIGALSTGV